MELLTSTSAEQFQQCAEFLPFRNRALGPLTVTVLPVPLAREGRRLPLAPPCNRQRCGCCGTEVRYHPGYSGGFAARDSENQDRNMKRRCAVRRQTLIRLIPKISFNLPHKSSHS